MYDFSGIIYRIWAVCGIMLILGIICIAPWKRNLKFRDRAIGVILITFAVCLGSLYAYRIVVPTVSHYTGEFISSNRNSRVAPPLPFTRQYVFWNGTEKKQVFYLDTFSKKEIFPCELETNRTYTVYFDEFTNVIVKIEID